MNKAYIATRTVRKRGRVWAAGEEVTECIRFPVWRDALIAAGAVRETPGPDFPEPADYSANEMFSLVKTLDNAEVLERMMVSEGEGRNRPRVVGAIDKRIDALSEIDPPADVEEETE